MTLKEAFRAALELDREDLMRLQDNISAVLESAKAAPEPQAPQSAKTRVKRSKKQEQKQKPAPDKVQHATTGVSDSDAPWS